jgi:D-apiose dehydrogenase
MTTAKLRVVGIGAGYFSRFHLEGWRGIDNVDVVGWCDSDTHKVDALAREFAIPRNYAAAEPMLDIVKADLVDIVTPPASHAALTAMAHARGIPVICQKPLTPSWQESTALVDAAERAGVLCVVHENFRFQPWYREAKRLLDAGFLGSPYGVAFRLRPGDGQGPRAYLDRQPYFQAMPRLLLVETAVHWIDTFRFLLGEVDAITARLRRLNPVIAGEDAGYLIFEFRHGVSGLFDGNRLNDHVAADPRRTMGEMWLEGSSGVLRLDGDARLWWKPHHGTEFEHTYDHGPRTFGGGCCGALQRHVVAHLTDGAPVENTARDYLANIRVQEAAYESHATSRCIALAGYEPQPTAAPFIQQRAAV